jgi:glycosyltransferase involved in cell wall biosynthesis
MGKQIIILVIGYVWPEPNSSAAGSRMLDFLLLFIQQGWNITFASPAAVSEFMADLDSLCIKKTKIELNNTSFDDFIKDLNPDIVLFDRFMMEEQFGWRVAETCPNAIRIIDTVDLHFLRNARQIAFKENREVSLIDFHSDMAKREIASILRSDISLIISEFEIKLLTDSFKIDSSLLYYLPLLTESIDEIKVKTWKSFEEKRDFIFIGNFLHEPNWDAVKYLKEDIWPLIRKQLPEAQLKIYGAYPPQKAMEMHKPKEGFQVLGRTEEADLVVSNARVSLAPLRFGAGVKGKLAEAMLCGTPSVTTDIGAEGMKGDYDWNGSIANSTTEIAKAAIELYQNKEAWNEARQNGIKIINNRNSKELFEQKMIKHYLSILNNRENHRANNFLGALLQHHTLSSTKYMARWIEAKNKRG